MQASIGLEDDVTSAGITGRTTGLRIQRSLGFSFVAATKEKPKDLWILRPVVRPVIPAEVTSSSNPIDACIAAEYRARGLQPVHQAGKRTLLRRVTLDLT